MAGQSRQAPSEHAERVGTASESEHQYDTGVSRTRQNDSWVEISSQHSSSSLSSAADEIVTTGLRVQQDSVRHRRRRVHVGPRLRSRLIERAPSAGSSSQDECEESESDSDRVLTSSNEGLVRSDDVRVQSPPEHRPLISCADPTSDDEDESATTLGVARDQQCFTPQPNAFSHPPSVPSTSPGTAPGSYFPSSPSPNLAQRHSHQGTVRQARQQQHSPYSAISASHHIDHDAALRASLSTLLTCAAAARGLPKRSSITPYPPTTRNQGHTTLRIVPESVLLGEDSSHPNDTAAPSDSRRPVLTRRISSSPSAHSATSALADKPSKRKEHGTSRDRRERVAKKARTEELVSPTLLTWVVSAGVLIVVSALSFSAGYAIGREVGWVEANGEWSGSPGALGHPYAKEMKGNDLGLRRLKWGGASSVVRA